MITKEERIREQISKYPAKMKDVIYSILKEVACSFIFIGCCVVVQHVLRSFKVAETKLNFPINRLWKGQVNSTLF